MKRGGREGRGEPEVLRDRAHLIFLQFVETSERGRIAPGDRLLGAGEASPTPALPSARM